MRTPKHLAFIAAVAFAVPILVSQVLTFMYDPPSGPATISLGILSGLIPGALVWVGRYMGARWAASHQRTVRLAQVLGVLYFIVGVAMTIPIKTDAALLEMDPARGSASPFDFISPVVSSVGIPLLMVVAPMLLTRGVAMLCGR